jgi:hypothetical protein
MAIFSKIPIGLFSTTAATSATLKSVGTYDASLALDFDPNAANKVGLSGVDVTTFTDKIGGVTVAPIGNSPELIESWSNGRPCISFVNANTENLGVASGMVDLASDFSIAMAFENTASSVWLLYMLQSSTFDASIMINGGALTFRNGVSNFSISAETLTSGKHIISISYDVSTAKLRYFRNGAFVGEYSVPNFGTERGIYFAVNSAGSTPYKLGRFQAYTSKLDDAALLHIQEDFNVQYAIY